MKISRFEDLEIWKSSIEITKKIYKLSSTGEFGKDYGLRDQIRRAVVSISSNIVEGFEKRNNNEFTRFLRIAKGSVGEVRNQLYISKILDYISPTAYSSIEGELEKLAAKIGKFISYLELRKKQKEFITR